MSKIGSEIECAVQREQCALRFFFNDTATTEIYTLSLHDALPIYAGDAADAGPAELRRLRRLDRGGRRERLVGQADRRRSEEHTSELQSRQYLVCRLLLEKKTTASRTSRSLCLWRRRRTVL